MALRPCLRQRRRATICESQEDNYDVVVMLKAPALQRKVLWSNARTKYESQEGIVHMMPGAAALELSACLRNRFASVGRQDQARVASVSSFAQVEAD